MKLSPLTFFIVGLSLALVALGIGLSQFIPNMAEAGYQNEYADKLRDEAGKQAQANKRVEDTVVKVNEMAREWQRVVAVKTPSRDLYNGGINLTVNRWQLTHDSLIYRDSIQKAVNAQMRRGGVTVVQGPTVPRPSESASDIVETYYNYPAIKFPVVIFDLGQVTVRGTLSQIAENMRAWSDMPRYLAVADGLRLQGTSPNLTGTYSVSLVGYIRGDRVAPPVPEGGGGGNNRQGGGAPQQSQQGPGMAAAGG